MWTLGDKLRKSRRDQGIGTTAMAVALNCHRNTILGWETDKALPPLGTIVRWSRLTHVPLAWFLDDFDPPSMRWGEARWDGSQWSDEVADVTHRYATLALAA